MQSLDTTILNTAVPVVSQDLQVAPLAMRAVLASYTLSLAVFIPISGWMADRFGTRRVFAWAIALFTLGSVLCGFCSNLQLLVACRLLQGVGGAMMVPVGRLTLVRTFAKSELVQAMSFVAVPGLAGPMIGPLAGGLIVAYLSWRFVFFLNVPIGLIGLVLVWMHLPDYRQSTRRPIDALGFLLFGSGIAILSYVLEIFGDHALTGPQIAGLTGLAVMLLAAYALHATRTTNALLDVALFRIRTFRAAVGGGFFTRLGIGGVPFLLPMLYQVGLGFTPIQSGLLIMPQAVASLTTKFLLPIVLARLGYRTVLLSNTIVIGAGLMIFALVGPGTPVWAIVILVAVFGVLQSLQYTSMNTLVYSDVPGARASYASSMAGTFQQLSLSVGVALAGLTTVLFIPAGIRADRDAFIGGVHEAFVALGVFTIASAAIFAMLRPGDGIGMSRRR
jgi:EmrB/QacA subfamily drug resistance transporter